MIRFHLDTDGGFTAGDTSTGLTAYAYPSSTHATRAKRDPLGVAAEMMASEVPSCRILACVVESDVHNWSRLDRAAGI